MNQYLRPTLALIAFFFVFTGIAFPLLVTAIAQVVFPFQANGSLIRDGNEIRGSVLIGQTFHQPAYFHTRPSAAGGGYDAGNSGGTNLGPLNPKLLEGVEDDPSTEADESFAGVKQLADEYRRMNRVPAETILPADAVTRSASGLDPHISVRNAELQAVRVAAARGIPIETVQNLISEATDPAFAGVFGSAAVNVVRLNRSLDQLTTATAPGS